MKQLFSPPCTDLSRILEAFLPSTVVTRVYKTTNKLTYIAAQCRRWSSDYVEMTMNCASGRCEDRCRCENNSLRLKTVRNACDAAGSLKTSSTSTHGAKDKPRFTASDGNVSPPLILLLLLLLASVIISHNAERELLKKSSCDVAIFRQRRPEDRLVASSAWYTYQRSNAWSTQPRRLNDAWRTAGVQQATRIHQNLFATSAEWRAFAKRSRNKFIILLCRSSAVWRLSVKIYRKYCKLTGN